MSLLKLLFNPYSTRHNANDRTIPLNKRFSRESVGVLLTGPLGHTEGVVKYKGSSVSIINATHSDAVLNKEQQVTAVRELSRKTKSEAWPIRLNLMPTSLIAGHSAGLAWHTFDWPDTGSTTLEFCRRLNAPNQNNQNLFPQYNHEYLYAGLLSPAFKAAVLGVEKSAVDSLRKDAAEASVAIARECIPSLSVMALLLASEQVTKQSCTPLVIDQGYATYMHTQGGSWDLYAGACIRNEQNTAIETESVRELFRQVPGSNVLVALSPLNRGYTFEHLSSVAQSTGHNLIEFSVGNLPTSQLFVYASTIL